MAPSVGENDSFLSIVSHGAFLGGITTLVLLAPYVLLQIIKLYILIIRPKTTYLHNLPGPDRPDNWVVGSQTGYFAKDPGEQAKEWGAQYGSVYKFWGFFGDVKVTLMDCRAIGHVFMNSTYGYQKAAHLRGYFAKRLGTGLLFAEGEQHKTQRRIMQPSFAAGHLRELVPIFLDCGRKLGTKWEELVKSDTNLQLPRIDPSVAEKAGFTEKSGGEGVVIDVFEWLSRATLDAVGLAGFGYAFNSVEGGKTELEESMARAVSSRASHRPDRKQLFLVGLIQRFPIMMALPTKRQKFMNTALKISRQECWTIFNQKKDAIRKAQEEGDVDAAKNQGDLLGLLLKANIVEEEKRRLTDEEVMSQMTTFVVAGHETTATGLSFALHRLAQTQNLAAQEKLRQEVKSAVEDARLRGEEIGDEEIDNLPYLDAVVRESLRLDGAVAQTVRVANNDDVIPLSQPVTLRDGREVDHISIKKGQELHIPILAINKSKDLWGEDAEDFRPERWLEGLPSQVTDNVKGGASVFSHMLTFAGGPRACIGYKFAILEMKAMLAVLLSQFKFSDLGLPIDGVNNVVTRPTLRGALNAPGPMLPLRVSLAS